MRMISVILTSAVVGTAIGAAMAYVEVRPGAGAPAARTATPDEPPPPGRFGAARRSRRSRRTTSAPCSGAPPRRTSSCSATSASGPLTLRVGSTSCKCTVGNVANEPIPPGETVNVQAGMVGPGESRSVPSDGDDPHERPAPVARRAVGRRRSDRGDRHLSARLHVRQDHGRRRPSRPTCL